MKWYLRLLLFFGWVSLFIAMFIFVLCIYWMVKPYDVLEFYEGNGEIINHAVQRGEYLEMRQHSCKKMDYVSELDRQFIDSFIYTQPTQKGSRGVGCYDLIEQIYIPKGLPSGDYYINTTISFKVNPIRTITYTVKTEMFTVTNGY